MQANTKSLGFKRGGVNQYSCYAEREETLSEIDSKYQNQEYTLEQAREKALSIPGSGGKEIIMAVFAPSAPKKVKASAQFNMGPRWAK